VPVFLLSNFLVFVKLIANVNAVKYVLSVRCYLCNVRTFNVLI
jgi:hypothetical protein